ncbi:hypothetical protein HK100_007495 [Physocladia obscura]|uniref:Importin N-terminal domain-containing protein n=1 Tax=Physocladia obscura TaxID=109957 RepID=A0AAD5TAI2_9FUNG|nr:hypothetical protein HK100_007495 [Physocladia obscura]
MFAGMATQQKQSTIDAATVSEYLKLVLNATNKAERESAEKALAEMAAITVYAPTLVNLALDKSVPFHLRQSAAVNLKNYIDKYWSSKEFNFVGPEPSAEAKAFVKSAVLVGLSDSESRIRVLMATTASKIANIEDLESWPELFQSLMSNLKSGAPDQIHGSLRVVSSFVDDISETQFAHIAPILLPQVYEIFANQNYNPRVRSRAISVFRKFLETLQIVEKSVPTAVQEFLLPQLPTWMHAFHQILAPMDISNEQIIFKTEIFYVESTTIEYLVSKFPGPMKPYFPETFQLVWRTGTTLFPVYKATTITTSDVDAVEEVDTDGDVMGLNSLLFNVFAIIGVAAENKGMDAVFVGTDDSNEFLKALVELGVSFSQISDGQIESWEADTNAYVQEEDETSPSFSMRYSITMLFDQLTTRHNLRFLQALFTAVPTLFEAAKRDSITEGIKSGKVSFDFNGFFEHVIQECIKCDSCPLLQGRALVFSSIFYEYIPTNQISQYINAMAAALSSNALSCKIGGLRALSQLASNSTLYPYFTQSIGNIIESVCTMAPSATEDLLLMLLESLVPFVKVDEALVTKYEASLIPLLVAIWTRDPEDTLVNVCVLNVFTTLSKNKLMFDALQVRLLPPLSHSIGDANLMTTQPGVYSNALMLLGVLIRGAASPLPLAYMNTVFSPLIQAMVTSIDNGILQEGQDCLQSMVLKDVNSVINWNDGSKNGLSYILDIIARLLDPNSDESSCLYIGSLITAVIKKARTSITPILPQLLSAIMSRLATAKYTQLIQTLLLVFANLILEHGSVAIVNFLGEVTVNDGVGQQRNGLNLFLNTWSDYYDEIMGFYNLKLNAAAMATFISQSGSDSRVTAVLVKGGLLLSADAGIVTRSKSKKVPDQYQMISFPAKAFKLLLKDYQQNRESAMKGDKAAVDELTGDSVDTEDESGEWEDDAAELDEAGDWFEVDGNEEEDDDTDPDLINNDIYNLKMTDYLSNFVKTCVQNNGVQFGAIANQILDGAEKKILASILSI